jgi:hypothetical protein
MRARMLSLQSGNPYPLRLVAEWVVKSESHATCIEEMVLVSCWRHWACGEWVHAHPATVCGLVDRMIRRFSVWSARPCQGTSPNLRKVRADVLRRGGLKVIEVVRHG